MSTLIIFFFITSTLFAQTEQEKSYLNQRPPSGKLKIFAPNIVSKDEFNHSSISMTPDANEIYWTLGHKIVYSIFNGKQWSEIKYSKLTNKYDGSEPMISPSGKRLFFTSRRPNNEKENIWYANRTKNGWGKAKKLPDLINSGNVHWQVTVDLAENLYFAGKRKSSFGRDDIYISEYTKHGYEKAKLLPESINTTASETTPFIDPQSKFLLFARTLNEEPKRTDLFISRLKNGRWQKAVNLGKPINRKNSNEVCPYISPDKKYLFFLRIVPGSKVYWINTEVIPELR